MAIKLEKDLPATCGDMWKRAVSAINANNPDYAISLLQNLLKVEPAFLDGRRRLRIVEMQKFKGQSSLSKQMVGVKTGSILMKASGLVKKSPQEAMVLAEEALAMDPFSEKANGILAQAAEAMGLIDVSALAYETICEGNPQDKEGFRRLGEYYTKQEKWEKAQNAYQRLLQIDARDGDAASALRNITAKMASLSGGWEKKDGDFRDSLKDKGEAAKLEQANKVVKSEEAVLAQITQLVEKVNQEPNNLTWPKQVAALYQQIEDFDSAIQWYEYTFERGGRVDNALEKSITDLKLKKLDKDIMAYRDAAVQDPATYKEYYDSLLVQRKQVVLETAQQRAAKYPNEFQFQYELGKAFVDLEMYKEAQQPLQLGMKSPAVRLEAMNLLGVCCWKRNMLDLAEKRFSEAANEVPVMNDVKKEILYNLSGVLEEAGKKEEAINKLKEIYEVDMAYRDVAARVEASYGG